MPRPPTPTEYLEAHLAFRGFAGQLRRLHGARLVTNLRYPHLPRANSLLIGAVEPPVPWHELVEESEPHLAAVGARFRRALLFGEDTAERLATSLRADGYRTHPLSLLRFPEESPLPEVMPGAVAWADTFRLPARYALRYRIAQERFGSGPQAAESARLYMSRADAGWRRTAAAFVDGSLAAAADLTPVGSIYEINTVETAPEFRGQGLAHDLVAFLVRESFASGARGVYLVTEPGALEERLYRPLGFARCATLVSADREL